MAEKYTGPEHQLEPMSPEDMLPAGNEQLNEQSEASSETAKNTEQDGSQKLTEARQELAEAQAEQSTSKAQEELLKAEKPSEEPSSTLASPLLYKMAQKREIKQLQRQLSAPSRAFSKVIHQPVVRVTSEIAAKTVSRPSGLLGGGLLAFAGSSTYLYLAKHQGFRYNYLVFTLLFVGGFLAGLVLELLAWVLVFRRRQT